VLDVGRCRGIKWGARQGSEARAAALELWNCGASSPDTCPVTLTPRHPKRCAQLLQTGTLLTSSCLHYT
jgi:hypothetical protein